MPGINAPITLTDEFSATFDKFNELAEKAAGISDKLDKAVESGSNVTKEASISTAAFGQKLQTVYFAMQNLDRFAEPVKEIIAEISDETRTLIMLGDEAGSGLLSYVKKSAAAMGRSAKELNKAGRMWADAGASGTDIMRMTELTNRMAAFKPENDFDEVANAFKEAIKTHSSGSLADLLGGGENIERKLNRAGLERALIRGDLPKVFDIFEQVADKVGYTKEKAEALSNTLDNRFRKVGNLIKNSFVQMATGIAKKLEPSINRFIELISSPEAINAVQKLSDGIAFIADGLIRAVSGVVSFVSNNAYLLETVAIFGSMALGISALPKLLALTKAAVIGLSASIGILKKGFLAFNAVVRANPIIAIFSVATGAVIAFQKIIETQTGVVISTMDAIIGIVVGGTVGLVTSIIELGQYLYNEAADIAVDIVNFVIDKAEHGINWILDNTINASDKIRDILGGLLDGFVSLARGLNTILDSDKLNNLISSVEEFKNKVQSGKPIQVKFERLETDVKRTRIDSAGITAKAIKTVIDAKNNLVDMISGPEDKENKAAIVSKGIDDSNKLKNLNGDVSKMRGMMQREQDLRWMKELAEREFVNNVNVRTLTPQVNITMQGGSTGRPEDIGAAVKKEIERMQAAGTRSSYGAA